MANLAEVGGGEGAATGRVRAILRKARRWLGRGAAFAARAVAAIAALAILAVFIVLILLRPPGDPATSQANDQTVAIGLSTNDKSCAETEETVGLKCRTILFVTNRTETQQKHDAAGRQVNDFTDKREDDLAYGAASVTVPEVAFQSAIGVFGAVGKGNSVPLILADLQAADGRMGEETISFDPGPLFKKWKAWKQVNGAPGSQEPPADIAIIEKAIKRKVAPGANYNIADIDRAKLRLKADLSQQKTLPAYLETLRKQCDSDGASQALATATGETDACTTAQKLGVNTFERLDKNSRGDDKKAKREAFKAEILRQLGCRDAAGNQTPCAQTVVTLYVHGFNTTFIQSLNNGAHVASDLGANFKQPKTLAGAPVVFSWATQVEPEAARKGSEDYTWMGAMAERYYTSQFRADQSAAALADTFAAIAEISEVTRVLVIAHSMGNRVLMGAYPEIVKRAHEKANAQKGFELFLVHFAGDYGFAQYKKKIEAARKSNKSDDGWSPVVMNYYSKSDLALRASHFSQLGKKDWYEHRDKYLKGEKPISPVGQVAGNEVLASSNALKKIFGEFEKLPKDQRDRFFKEDHCRLGLETGKAKVKTGYTKNDESYDRQFKESKFDFQWTRWCSPPAIDGKKLYATEAGVKQRGRDAMPVNTAINMTGYGTENYRHNYYEFSPMALADISCALDGIRPDDDKRSLLKENKHWLIKLEAGLTKKKDAAPRECEAKLFVNLLAADYDGDIRQTTAKPALTASAVARSHWKFGAAVPAKEFADTGLIGASCEADAIVAIGLTSREGMAQSNRDLANQRADALFGYLEASPCKGKALKASIGFACRNDDADCKGDAKLAREDQGSDKERPLLVVAIKTGGREFSEAKLVCMAKAAAIDYLGRRYSEGACTAD